MKKKNIVQKRTYRSLFTNLTRTITGGMVSALALVLTLSACGQINEDLDPSKGMINFGASTGYVNAPQTKTEYSGVDETGVVISSTSQYERIDWVDNHDYIKVLCDQAVDVNGDPNTINILKITGHTGTGATKESTVAGVSYGTGSQFYWGDGNHYFYALYPAAGTTSNYHDGTVTDNDSKIEPIGTAGTQAKITGSVPAAQSVVLKSGTRVYKPNMNRAYMYAAKKTAPTNETVTLEFYPLVTAFEFYLKALDDAMANHDLKTLKLTSTSTDMTGGFTATLNLDASTVATITKASTGLGKEITVTFPTGTRLDKTAYTDVTVLALGVEQTDLKLTLTFDGGITRSIDLKKADNSSVSVGACNKIYMKLGVPDDPIFEVTPVVTFDWEGNQVVPDPTAAPSVTSKTIFGDDLAWEVKEYYLDEDCTTPVPADQRDPVTGIPIWLTSLLTSGDGSMSYPIVCPQQDPEVSETLTNEAITENNKVNVTPIGSTSAYKNLSNPTNMDSNDIIESANCYIVNGPGYYKLPLVMGNGVKNNALNPDAKTYKGKDGRSNGVSKEDWRALFQDYKGNNIQNPYLHKSSTGAGIPTSAYIIWEDIEGLIETDEYILPSNCITYDSSGDCYWLNFHVASVRTGNDISETTNVPAANGGAAGPRQGNAVIAVKDAAGLIMWNYHIWLTDYKTTDDIDLSYRFYLDTETYPGDPTDYLETDFDKIIDYKMMNRDLGFTIYGRTVDRDYPANTVYVKFEQQGTHLLDTMKINQTAHNVHTQIDRGRPTFQYGRTFAIWPDGGLLTNGEEMVWYGTTPTFVSETGTHTQAQSIQKAGFFFGRSSLTDEDSPILTTISVQAPASVTFNGSQYGYKWTGNSNPGSVYPTNFWDADEKFVIGSANISLNGVYVNHNSTPDILLRRTFGFASPSGTVLPNKTILDPNPAGYVMPGLTLQWIFRHQNFSSVKDTPSGFYTWNRFYLGNPEGTSQFIGLVGNNFEFYTSPDKNASKKMYVPNGYAKRDITGALESGWSVCAGNVYLYRHNGENILGGFAYYTKPDGGFSITGKILSCASRPLRDNSNQYWGLFPYVAADYFYEMKNLNDTRMDRPADSVLPMP